MVSLALNIVAFIIVAIAAFYAVIFIGALLVGAATAAGLVLVMPFAALKLADDWTVGYFSRYRRGREYISEHRNGILWCVVGVLYSILPALFVYQHYFGAIY